MIQRNATWILAVSITLAGLYGCPCPPTATGPTADFSATPSHGVAPLTVQFADLSMPDGAAITEWYWNFGDGNTGTGANPTHAYEWPGAFTVSLRVVAADGSAVAVKPYGVSVQHPMVPPTAGFEAAPMTGSAPLTVAFTDVSVPGSTPITAWDWDFGDGQISMDRHPLHRYEAEGVYTVSLTISSISGSHTSTRTDLIAVSPAPVAVTIDDPALEAALRAALGVPAGALFDTVLAGLESLDASGLGVGNLGGLEYCTGLQTLDLSGNGIVILTPLTSLGALVWLDLSDNLIQDIAALTQNPGLDAGDVLWLNENPLSPDALCEDVPLLTGRGLTVGHDHACGDVGDPDSDLRLTRSFPMGDVYTPGETVDVAITFEYLGNAQVLALGLKEWIPPGWAFVELVEGAKPASSHQPLGEQTLEFIWIEVPVFPATFTYRLGVPQDATGNIEFEGVGFYREHGPELPTNAAESVLTEAGP